MKIVLRAICFIHNRKPITTNNFPDHNKGKNTFNTDRYDGKRSEQEPHYRLSPASSSRVGRQWAIVFASFVGLLSLPTGWFLSIWKWMKSQFTVFDILYKLRNVQGPQDLKFNSEPQGWLYSPHPPSTPAWFLPCLPPSLTITSAPLSLLEHCSTLSWNVCHQCNYLLTESLFNFIPDSS